MADSISCASTSHSATCQLVCPLRTINVRMTTPFLVSGATIAPILWARVVQPSPAAVASSLPFQVPRPIASLTSNGAQCISPIILKRRISRCACMKIIPISGLTSSSAPSSPAAINSMFLVYRARTTPLLRTSAMARRPQARALTPAQVAEHLHLRQRRLRLLQQLPRQQRPQLLQRQPPQLLQQPLQLLRQLRLGRHRHQGRLRRQGRAHSQALPPNVRKDTMVGTSRCAVPTVAIRMRSLQTSSFLLGTNDFAVERL